VRIEQAMLDEARAAMPELPADRAARLEREHGLSEASARQLAFRAELGDFFEAGLRDDGGVPAQPLANWVTGELVARIGDEDPGDSRVQPGALAALVGMVERKEVHQGGARQVLDRLVADGGEPRAIVEADGLGAIGGEAELSGLVDAALEANASAADKIREGNEKPMGAIIGHVMRETKGRADGGEVTRLVREKLGV
jgi:aspartyl-tRNA(Asn)/glutamyl-tRNA(Gln) amidotransferase subunit B